MENNDFRVGILDYGMGNIFSVKKACDFVGLPNVLTSDKEEAKSCQALILPGVGAFGNAMKNLSAFKLDRVIENFVADGKHILGVCLGMQLLMDESEEFGLHKGLGIIGGSCHRFPDVNETGTKNRIPQITWNKIYSKQDGFDEDSPLKNIPDAAYMYFVHSYYVKPDNPDTILSYTTYNGLEYCSSIKKNKTFAFQFHPEKSGEQGLGIYLNFKNIVQKDLC